MMAIPREILEIPRPRNTIVVAYGKNRTMYAVRERIGCRYENGRRLPITGKTIGHIICGEYVPKDLSTTIQSLSKNPIELKDWANIVLCVNISSFLLKDLLLFYNYSDAIRIYCISILRVCYPGIRDNELSESYEESFLSEMYPNVGISKNTVSVFLNNIGKAYSRICRFMQLRVSKVEKNHHLIIDGTLKTDNSECDTFSEFSRKFKESKAKEISILYAYDLELAEPICCQCFPGNMIDATAYENFINQNEIKRGVIVGDKGFPSSSAKKYFTKNKNLHYLNPLKRNCKYINQYDLTNFTDQLPEDESILCKKIKINRYKCIYVFKDINKSYREDCGWLKKAKNNKNFNVGDFNKDRELFGVVIFESNLDTDLSTIYKIYDTRWEIEILMRYYKQTCEFDTTRVHDDYSVIGSEFCNFLSTIITYKLLSLFRSSLLLESHTYKKIMRILHKAKKVKFGEVWKGVKINPSQEKILDKLNLLSEFTH